MKPVEMVETRINGQWTLLLPSHRAQREEWTNTVGWERERVASLHANLKPGDLIVDVGSEEGDLPALWASWGCDVFLIEPNPRVWPNIRACFEANQLEDRVAGWWVGLASDVTDESPGLEPDRDGWPECAYGPVIGDHGFASLYDGRPSHPQITIDALVARTGIAPTALNLDVEGGEQFVIAGALETIREHKPLIWISVHPEFMFANFGQYEGELHTLLHQVGYVKTHLAFDHEHHVFYWLPGHHDPVLPCLKHGYDECP